MIQHPVLATAFAKGARQITEYEHYTLPAVEVRLIYNLQIACAGQPQRRATCRASKPSLRDADQAFSPGVKRIGFVTPMRLSSRRRDSANSSMALRSNAGAAFQS
jgi:hypothetical protein